MLKKKSSIAKVLQNHKEWTEERRERWRSGRDRDSACPWERESAFLVKAAPHLRKGSIMAERAGYKWSFSTSTPPPLCSLFITWGYFKKSKINWPCWKYKCILISKCSFLRTSTHHSSPWEANEAKWEEQITQRGNEFNCHWETDLMSPAACKYDDGWLQWLFQCHTFCSQ